MTLYRADRMLLTWVWRWLILGGLIIGAVSVTMALTSAPTSWRRLLIGVGCAAIPLALGHLVATRIDRRPDGRLKVWTLSLSWRTIDPARVGRVRYRVARVGRYGQMSDAPHLWVELRGGPPLYLDLLADIPDRRALRALFPYDDGAAPTSRPPRKGRRARDNS
jgi:hypothetical protein